MFLLQLMVVLLCNLVQDKGGKGGHDRLGPNSTVFLIFVVFGSTLAYFGMTVHATVRGSLKTKGVVGKLANGMAKCCRIEPKKGNGGQRGEDRSLSLARVVPVQREEQDRRRQKSTLKNEIAALKWQKKIRQTLVKNSTKPLKMSRTPSRLQQNRTWRTQRVEEIQNTHENHRKLALKNIERQHSQRRTSLQMRVEARNKKREQGEEVAMGEADGIDMDVEKVVVKDGGKSMADKLVKQTLATTECTVVTVDKHGKTEAEPVSHTLESEKMLKSVRLQQRIQRIKEVQMGRLRAKRLAKGT